MHYQYDKHDNNNRRADDNHDNHDRRTDLDRRTNNNPAAFLFWVLRLSLRRSLLLDYRPRLLWYM